MRVMVFACVVLAASTALASSVFAQPDAARAPAPANPAVKALVRGVNAEGRVRDLDVRKLDVRVRLRGALAETSIEMRVFATTSESVEGRVHVDLPPGSMVTGYAVDIGGVMVEGSLVDATRTIRPSSSGSTKR